MESAEKQLITVKARIKLPLEKVWQYWTAPQHIVKWHQASDDWHSPRAENDFREGGRFLYRMEARDGSVGFDFSGRYTSVQEYKQIDYTMDDNRTVKTSFSADESGTSIVETFEAENNNSPDVQRQGWQAILNNFKKYSESLSMNTAGDAL
jgi:uncharacterized protein YndB with AHSA1/START domain